MSTGVTLFIVLTALFLGTLLILGIICEEKLIDFEEKIASKLKRSNTK